ncbi:MAG: sulfatase [Myxococcales bacterium]|nr:sulfatase [Myxococcales bacterium]MCB9580882.1 sulfatase [Polyangiaceae bacterium]
MKRLAALALLVVGCASRPQEPPPAPPAPPARTAAPIASAAPAPAVSAPPAAEEPKPLTRPERPLNVLLILVDSMRADMPWAGYERPIAPNLTALEKESVSYTHAYSTSSYTAKSVASILSGKYPSSLKRSGFFFTRYPESNLFFAELLQKAGVFTAAVHGHMYMRPGHNGMDQGFDDWEVVDGISFDNTTDKFVTSDKMTPLAIKILKKKPENERFFMYAHYMDPHDVYVKHPESPDWGDKARDRYDSEVFYADLWIGKLLAWCKQQPWWGDTAVIVSADHGEAFGEHKRYRHAFELWDMLTHVPLFFYVPGATPRHIDTPRGNIDIAKTVMDLMDVKADNDFVGESLVPELFGAEPPPRPVLLDLPPDSNNPERRALIQGHDKLLVFGNDYRFDLYDLKRDPGELSDLAKKEPEKLQEMKALYEKVWGAVPKVKPYGGNKLQGGGVANGPAN